MTIDAQLTRTRVKMCGFTRAKDAVCAAKLGVDAIGLVFYENSPRYVSKEQARAIINALPPFVTVVGLFVDSPRAFVESILGELTLDILQFHGSEERSFCSSFSLPYLKAVRVKQSSDIIQASRTYDNAQGLLLDAWHPDIHGGTGLQFDWSILANELAQTIELPLVLAGGLDSTNIYAAMTATLPYGVDVSSGVESGKGIKDSLKMADFLKEVYRFDSTNAV